MRIIKILSILFAAGHVFAQDMSKDYVVKTDLAAIQAIQAKLDAALGYPKEGVKVGGGLHASKAESTTLHHAPILKHPTRNEWALQVQGVTQHVPEETPVKLTEDWKPQSEK